MEQNEWMPSLFGSVEEKNWIKAKPMYWKCKMWYKNN